MGGNDDMKKKILILSGTRPEVIKMAPVILAFQSDDRWKVINVSTGQHRDMVIPLYDFFNIFPDYDLSLMTENQSLGGFSAKALSSIDHLLEIEKPDVLLVQGDTNTVLMGALAAYYHKIKIGHVEAGLRTGDLYSPWPEEGNRLLTSRLTDFHFCPTEKSCTALRDEGVTRGLYVTGNTVIDALTWGLQKIKTWDESMFPDKLPVLSGEKIILITGHRRESFGLPFEGICQAILDLATAYPRIDFVYPVHLNPQVRKKVFTILGGIANIYLIEPISYPTMILLMKKSFIIMTDSGGIQEEAPVLGKPVLILREKTERPEGITAGTSILVGTDRVGIVEKAKMIIENQKIYDQMAKATNPFGDGTSAMKIKDILDEDLLE